MRYFFESIPIVLAVVSIAVCTREALTSTNDERMLPTLQLIASVMMLVAQFSWMWSFLVKGDQEGTDIANMLWTVFNGLTMFIFIASCRKK